MVSAVRWDSGRTEYLLRHNRDTYVTRTASMGVGIRMVGAFNFAVPRSPVELGLELAPILIIGRAPVSELMGGFTSDSIRKSTQRTYALLCKGNSCRRCSRSLRVRGLRSGSGRKAAAPQLPPPVLLAPSSGSDGITTRPQFLWHSVSGSAFYVLQMALDTPLHRFH